MRHMTSLRYIDAVAREKSIRKAADTMAITATALNRRILAIEEELGEPIFERLPSGMRLNAAGEIFIQYIRNQFSDLDRVRTQISDLAGIRRGHVTIACAQDALYYFLPKLIAKYRTIHPAVTFAILQKTGHEAELALQEHHADIAIICEPIQSPYFYMMGRLLQPICCIMTENHPLRKKQPLFLQDCIDYPLILPNHQSHIRQLLERISVQKNLNLAHTIETNSYEFIHSYLRYENALSFQMPATMAKTTRIDALISRPLDNSNLSPAMLNMGYLKGKVLSVAAANFLDYSIKLLREAYPDTVTS